MMSPSAGRPMTRTEIRRVSSEPWGSGMRREVESRLKITDRSFTCAPSTRIPRPKSNRNVSERPKRYTVTVLATRTESSNPRAEKSTRKS